MTYLNQEISPLYAQVAADGRLVMIHRSDAWTKTELDKYYSPTQVQFLLKTLEALSTVLISRLWGERNGSRNTSNVIEDFANYAAELVGPLIEMTRQIRQSPDEAWMGQVIQLLRSWIYRVWALVKERLNCYHVAEALNVNSVPVGVQHSAAALHWQTEARSWMEKSELQGREREYQGLSHELVKRWREQASARQAERETVTALGKANEAKEELFQQASTVIENLKKQHQLDIQQHMNEIKELHQKMQNMVLLPTTPQDPTLAEQFRTEWEEFRTHWSTLVTQMEITEGEQNKSDEN